MFLRKLLIFAVIIITSLASLWAQDQNIKKEEAINKVGEAMMTSGPDEAIRLLKTMVKESSKYHWNSFHFIGLAHNLMYGKKVAHAIEFLELFSKVSNDSPDVYIALGEAYLIQLDKKNAMLNFEKALQMNPKNHTALKMLRNLDRNILALQKGTILEMKYAFEKPQLLQGLYLGQQPPGLKPEIFAPNLLSTEYSEVISMVTRDGREIWFGVSLSHHLAAMMVTREKNLQWINPEEFSFSENLKTLTLSQTADGKRIYFSTLNPDTKSRENYDIYYVDKTVNGWSEPKALGAPVNTEANERHPFFSFGKLYFASDRAGSLGGLDIFFSEIMEGRFSVPVNMGTSINSSKWEWDVSISPDEKYLIVGSNRDSKNPNSFDLFISFKGKNGQWSQAKNMGLDVNSAESELGVVFSPDGKYIFFHSTRIHPQSEELGYGNGKADIYWIDSKIIDKYRPKKSQK